MFGLHLPLCGWICARYNENISIAVTVSVISIVSFEILATLINYYPPHLSNVIFFFSHAKTGSTTNFFDMCATQGMRFVVCTHKSVGCPVCQRLMWNLHVLPMSGHLTSSLGLTSCYIFLIMNQAPDQQHWRRAQMQRSVFSMGAMTYTVPWS